jgi:MarR family 2-MHQ and catechol resistance regulon transcriptional repressor
MQNTPSPTPSFALADHKARIPKPPADPLIARLDQAVLSLAALAARPQFHAESRARAGLGRHHFPDHPARRVDPALYGVLAALAGEGMPGPSSIAVRLGLHPSTVSHHLDRLQRRGLVERRPCFAHRKWRNVELTAAGKEAYETIRDARHEALAALVRDWVPEDRQRLADLVARLGDAVRVHNLHIHERALDKAREATFRRSPEQREKARQDAHERYLREKEAAWQANRQRSGRERRSVRVSPSDFC